MDVSVCQLLFLIYLMSAASSGNEPEYYVSTEHINITYFNHKYFEFFHAKAARPGRWDYKYYVQLHGRAVKTLDNNITVHYLFYEFRSNEYRRGFVEMHFLFCDLILKDKFFGPALRANVPSCPMPPGEYNLVNMSIPDLPLLRTFPFRKGRIYCTGALADGVRVAQGYVDMEIKMKPRMNRSRVANVSKASLI